MNMTNHKANQSIKEKKASKKRGNQFFDKNY